MPSKKPNITEVVLRDGQQSLIATRMKTEDMLPVLSKLDKVGYSSLEVWGGATYDCCLRFLNENPWDRLKIFKKNFKKTKLQMLLRGKNLVGYKEYDDSVIELFIKNAAKEGINIFRIFDALNDIDNIKSSIEFVNNEKENSQGTICYTTSPVHNEKYWIKLAKDIEDIGAKSLAIKDMAGLLSPYDASMLVSGLKQITDIPIQLHNHYTSGLASMTQIKAIESGVDGVDTCVSTVSQRTSQPAIEPLSKTFDSENSNYKIDVNMNTVSDIAEILEKEVKKYTEYNVTTKFSPIDADVLSHQIPGGMISNLASQLSTNNNLDKLPDVLKEIPNVRKDLGMPPLVTPISQMVGAQSVSNVLTGRYANLSQQMQEYINGGYGTPPSNINKKIEDK